MSKYYADYAYEWKTEHPIQTFLMGIETSKDWKSFGSDSDYYYNKPEEAGMLALTPFKSGSHIFGFVAYVFILIMLFCSVYYMQFSFDTMMYLCGAFTLCHCVYMYYFTSLPRMKDENLRKKHTLSELILIVGLFLPLSLMYLNYQNQEAFNAWVAKYELANKYSKTALMEVYQSAIENDEVEERKNWIHEEVMAALNLDKKTYLEVLSFSAKHLKNNILVEYIINEKNIFKKISKKLLTIAT